LLLLSPYEFDSTPEPRMDLDHKGNRTGVIFSLFLSWAANALHSLD